MQIVESTFIALLLVLVVLVRGPYRGLPVFFFAIPFGMMAAVNLPAVGNTSVMAFDLVLLTLGTLLLLRIGLERDLGRLLALNGATIFLLLFAAYAIVATVFLPRIFAGETEVFSIGRVTGQRAPGIISRPLGPGGGNLTQMLRLVLGL